MLGRIIKSIKKNGILNTFKIIFLVIFTEVRKLPRSFIFQWFAKRKYNKFNIILPKYLSSPKVKLYNTAIFRPAKLKQLGTPIHIDFLDQINIIKHINITRPKIILELGAGYSTYSIIYSLIKLQKKHNHKFKFFCVDQNKEYLDYIVLNMPEVYKKNITFLHRDIYVDEFNGQKMSFYKNLPDEDYNFIYEDRIDHPDTKLAGDIIKFDFNLINNNNFSFIIDGMKTTVDYYKKYLKNDYKYSGKLLHGINFNKK